MGKTTQKKRLKALFPVGRGRWPVKNPIPLPLFDAPAVTESDIALWLATLVPHVSPLRYPQYVHDYNVAGKVAAAKAAGRWPPTPP